MSGDLNDLEAKIREARDTGPSLKSGRIRKDSQNKAGMQAGMEFVVSIALSSFIGFKIDQWAGTMPLFLIILFILGTGAGFMSIFRASRNLGSAVGYSALHREEKNANKAPDDHKP